MSVTTKPVEGNVEEWVNNAAITAGVLEQTAALAQAANTVPVLGLIATPFSVGSLSLTIKKYIYLNSLSKKLSDKAYWVSQIVSQVSGLLAEVIKPVMIALDLTGYGTTRQFLLVSRKILPPAMLALESIRFACAGWKLARIGSAYLRFRKEGVVLPSKDDELAKHLFDARFRPYHINVKGVEPDKLQAKLRMGIKVSMLNQSLRIVGSALAISAAALLIINPVGLTFTTTAVIVASTAVMLIPFVVNKILAEKNTDIV